MSDLQVYEGVLAVVQKEKSLIEAFSTEKSINKVFVFAPPEILAWPNEKKEQFIKKTMITIAHDEKLKPCFDTDAGKLSLMNAVTKCCSTGLEIGGKHAYLIPQRKGNDTEARFSIRAGGYYALLCGGDRPIFQDLRWGRVYAGDDCSIDEGLGTVSNKKKAGSEEGELQGVWVQIVKMNGSKEVKYFSMKKIEQWKAFSKSKNVWNAWPDEMAEQASIRHACDKYEQARDLLVASIYDGKGDGLGRQERKSGFEAMDELVSEDEDQEPDDVEKKESDDSF